MSNSCTCNTSYSSSSYILLNLSMTSKCMLKHDRFSQKEGKSPPAFHFFFRLSEDMQYRFQPLDGPFNQEMRVSSLSLSRPSSSVPTKWMTAFRNTRVRHDSEVYMLCHLCSTCFDASASGEAEENQAYKSTSSLLMLQPGTESRLITPL